MSSPWSRPPSVGRTRRSGEPPEDDPNPAVTAVLNEPELRPQAPMVVALDGLKRSLREIARDVYEQVGHVDGVGATLLVEGVSVFAGSNAFTEAVDKVQYGAQQGPCLSAVSSRRMVRSRSIDTDESRWGLFTPSAADLGLRSVASVPLWSTGDVVGSLNLYGQRAGSFDGADLPSIQRHADLVGREMVSAWLVAVATANAHVVRTAIADREDVDMAVGLLVDRDAVTVAHARVTIGQLAAADGVTEAVAARRLVDGPAVGAGPRPPEHG